MRPSQVIAITVGTPGSTNGGDDLFPVQSAIQGIARSTDEDNLIVQKRKHSVHTHSKNQRDSVVKSPIVLDERNLYSLDRWVVLRFSLRMSCHR